MIFHAYRDWKGNQGYHFPTIPQWLTKLKPLTLCMPGNFSCFCCCLLTFFKISLFKKFFQEHYHSVKTFGSSLCRTFYLAWSGSNLSAKVISRQKISLHASKELIKFYKKLQQTIFLFLFHYFKKPNKTWYLVGAGKHFTWNVKQWFLRISSKISRFIICWRCEWHFRRFNEWKRISLLHELILLHSLAKIPQVFSLADPFI